MLKIGLSLVLCATLLGGCETMSAPQCRVADWQRVGFQDGASGSLESRLADHAESCAQAGVVPDALAYRRGWDEGIVQFCTARVGWREGTLGHSGREAACRGQAGYAVFTRYLDAGLQWQRISEALRRNSMESRRAQQRLEEAQKDEERSRLREELRHIDREQWYLRNLLNQQQMLAP